jgi:hypothetical protein
MAACSAVEVDPFAVPVDRLSDTRRSKVEHVLADVAAVVPLEAEDVRSSLEIYGFLLDEMPFTGGVVRELGRGKWDIFRDPKEPDREVFYVIDPEGFRLRFEQVLREETRRVYVTRGTFLMGILPALEGSTVIVMRMAPKEGSLRTDAVVFVRVETPFYRGLAKGLRGLVESKVRERAGYFIRAAKWVAEEAASRPDWLHTQVAGSKEVDPGILEEFRSRFLR